MKRLFWVNLILICLLTSCATFSDSLKEEAASPGKTKSETLLTLEKAYSADPEDRNVSYNWAFALASEGKLEEARSVASASLALYPETVRFYTLKAYTEKELGMLRKYEKTYEALLLLDEAYTAIALELMHHYEALFEHDKACEKARLVLKYEKDNAEAIAVLARHDAFYALLKPEEEEKVPYRKRNERPDDPPIHDLSRLELLPLTDR